MLKWQLLSELLNCSMKMVTVRSSSGAINDARLQCLEALKLAIKLQAPSQYVHVHHSGLDVNSGSGSKRLIVDILAYCFLYRALLKLCILYVLCAEKFDKVV